MSKVTTTKEATTTTRRKRDSKVPATIVASLGTRKWIAERRQLNTKSGGKETAAAAGNNVEFLLCAKEEFGLMAQEMISHKL